MHQAARLKLKISDGVSFAGGKGQTAVAMKAVHTADMLYLPANTAGGAYWVRKGDGVLYDDSRFKPDDEVAGHIGLPLQGDRADVRVAVG